LDIEILENAPASVPADMDLDNEVMKWTGGINHDPETDGSDFCGGKRFLQQTTRNPMILICWDQVQMRVRKEKMKLNGGHVCREKLSTKFSC
jgi:hypothetical protein